MQLTEQQTKKANELLDLLCKNRDLGAERAYSIFDSKSDAEYVCTELAKENFLFAHWGEGHEIYALLSNEKTCNAVATNLLDKKLMQEAKLDSKAQLETEIAELTVLNLKLQNSQLKTKTLFSIIGFIIGVIVTNWKEILIVLKIISPTETK